MLGDVAFASCFMYLQSQHCCLAARVAQAFRRSGIEMHALLQQPSKYTATIAYLFDMACKKWFAAALRCCVWPR